MAGDVVTTNVVLNSKTHYIVHLTNISDGTGESTVTKVDKSTLVDMNGVEPASLDIEQVEWNIQGFTSVRILWDHTTDDVGLVLCASGYKDFGYLGHTAIGVRETSGLKDPRSAGGPGDILLTTNGGSSGATYDITLWLRKANA